MREPAAVAELDVFTCGLDGVRLIEASAGTGKTWNICGLYLRLLLERRLDVRQVLVVSFTRAATAELKTRIRARLVETLACLETGGTMADGHAPSHGDLFVPRLLATLGAAGHSSGDLHERLSAALQGFDEAAIFTIHGYCQRALADTPFAAGLPFALELVEDDAELRREAARDFWRRHILTDACPAALAETLIAHRDEPDAWAELLKAVLARPLAEQRWPEHTVAPPPLDELEAGLRSAFEAARNAWQHATVPPDACLLDALDRLNKQTYKPDTVRSAASAWRSWLAAGDALVLPDPKARLELFGAARLAERCLKHRTPPSHPFFDAAAVLLESLDAWRLALEAARLALLRRFVDEAGAQLQVLKHARRQVAFDDILANVHRALAGGANPWLAAALRRRYPAALIDEFQDTDPLQFDIFRRIYGTGGQDGERGEGAAGSGWTIGAERAGSEDTTSLFLVGDPKQAIYSFRNADLHTYLHARSQADAEYTLGHNQRSDAALIDACNRLFAANPAAFVLEGLRYRPVSVGDRPRKAFVDDSGAARAPLQLWRLDDGAGGPPLRAVAMQDVAHACAAEIARLIGAGAAGRITLGGRSLRPGDIAVLVRSHTQGARMRAALARFAVGSVELSQSSVYASVDAEELERVLLAVAEPARQAVLLSALSTAMMGCDATELARLAGDDAGLLAHIDAFSALRELWLARGFGRMLRQWMADAGVAARLLAREDGERRLTNLLHLAECLQEAAAAHASPESLLRWFASRRRDATTSEAAQLRLESDRNLVQIVTIHRAKGLEYGVVFCPFLWDGYRSPARSAARGEVVGYHDQAAADGLQAPRLVLDFRPGAGKEPAIAERIRAEEDAETVRLIYVALTRAVHRCYLVVGSYLSAGRAPSDKESARGLLNWLVAGAGQCHRDWVDARLEPPSAAAINAAWQALAADAPGVAVAPLPRVAGEALRLSDTSPEALAVLPPPRAIAPGWRIGSFSALSHGAHGEQAAVDHDARAQAADLPDERPPAAPLPADDILLFPRGAVAGDCIHAVFEYLDFTDPASRAPAIARALAEHPQRDADPAALAPMLARMVADVLATPLPDGIRLDALARQALRVELGFHLPTAGLTPERLAKWGAEWGARHGHTLPRLSFAALNGYLKGFIDLVFVYRGRYYLLDWKSNHLGVTPAAYAPARLADAMHAHAYHLQHLIYTVALHRHLRRGLPGYDFKQHFGGVLYLFVRGVRPGWRVEGGDAPGSDSPGAAEAAQAELSDGMSAAGAVPAQAGVFFHRPQAAAIAALDALIGGG
ncbi:MAG: exodeoxyribonuclease V subunit beta [Rhodocyclaceae bacterium]